MNAAVLAAGLAAVPPPVLAAWAVPLTLAVLLACVLALTFTRAAPDAVLTGGLVLLLAAGVVPLEAALAGFGNPGLAAVAALFAVAEGLRQTGAVEYAGRRMLGRPKTVGAGIARVAAPAALVSAFLNNTPVVAAALPVVSDWARRNNFSPSHLLMPLSFGAVLGGMCTLFGTSTLLVLNGEYRKLPEAGGGLGLFDVAWIGVPTAVLGVIYLVFATPKLLPERRPAADNFNDPKEYAVEMLLDGGSPLVGKTVEDAGLRHLPGAYLLEIARETEGGERQTLPAVGPNERLRAGDRLVFVGVVDSVKDLRRLPGLVPATDQTFKLNDAGVRQLVEAVVSDGYPFLNRTVRESRFRSHYNAAIIAVARGGERLAGRIGDVRLQPGDTLLLEAPPGFVKLRRYSKHFFLVSGVEDSVPPRFEKAWLARGILVAMVVAVAAGWFPPFVAAALALGAMIGTRCLLISEARRSVDWGVLIAIAAGLGLGEALKSSGTAAVLASGLTGLAGGSAMGQLAALFLLTAVLANLITAKAAGVIVYSIAVAVAARLGLHPLPFILAVMAAASGVFASPVGFQTNLMVLGPGGYRASDYLRLGLPLTGIVFAVTMAVIPVVWGFEPAPAAAPVEAAPPPAAVGRMNG